MNPYEDLAIQVLKYCYDICLDCERHAVAMHGASVFLRGLQQVFPQVHEHFFAKVGNNILFCGWLEDWLNRGTLCQEFPQLFALERDHEATIRECWDNTWKPILEGVQSDQRVEDLPGMQTSLLYQTSQRVGMDVFLCSGSLQED